MRLMTIFGTRPEIIRLSVIIKQLDQFCDQISVHTGQNYDESLSEVFFRDLELRPPNLYLGVRANSFSEQIGQILERVDQTIEAYKPDRILILGDTNSGLASIVAARRGIPVFHLEAGNRCYDDRVPEEVNRRIIDHTSTVLMPYTHRSKENLLREGIERQRIFVVGNPIYEVINNFQEKINQSNVLSQLGLSPQNYFVVTMHRAENVDIPQRLAHLLQALSLLEQKHQLPIIVSLHPRTADKIERFGIEINREKIIFLPPLGFLDFVTLEKNAKCVISDSGTVQEECCIFGVPNVTIRSVTERAETIECGSNILTGEIPEMVVQAVTIALETMADWVPPLEYTEKRVSTTVTKIVLGYHFLKNRMAA